MAADILLFDTDVVPVGKDQKQHVEICADIAGSINHCYGQELLKIPQPLINEETKTIVGLDGRKMSKSYNNTIPLYMPKKKLRKLVMKIVTNSQGVEEPKNPKYCNIFSLFSLYSTQEEQDALKARYHAGGLGWGHAKQALFEQLESTFQDKRARYDELMADRQYLDDVLKDGASRAREIAAQTMSRLRHAAGFVG